MGLLVTLRGTRTCPTQMPPEGPPTTTESKHQPGKPPDMNEPFLIPEQSTVGELARTIHKELAARLKFARIWGSSQFEGQQVHHDYVLAETSVSYDFMLTKYLSKRNHF